MGAFVVASSAKDESYTEAMKVDGGLPRRYTNCGSSDVER
jgi:hypothetical protein